MVTSEPHLRRRVVDAADASCRSRGRAARDSSRRNRCVRRRGARRQSGLHAAQRRRTVPHACRTDARGRRRPDGRGDIVYANAAFAALIGEPLESVVGGRLDRFVDGVRQTRRGNPDRPGQRSMSKPPGRIGFTTRRGEPVAHDHEVPVWRSLEPDRDGLERVTRGSPPARSR